MDRQPAAVAPFCVSVKPQHRTAAVLVGPLHIRMVSSQPFTVSCGGHGVAGGGGGSSFGSTIGGEGEAGGEGEGGGGEGGGGEGGEGGGDKQL